MSEATDDFPLLSARARRLIVLAHAGSTNAELVASVAQDPRAWPHLAVLLTEDQRAGRGRRDRVWTAPPGAALALSVVIDAAPVPLPSRGWLPLVAGAAMTRAVARQLAGTPHTASLKWPNDVLIDGRKVCGILAEVVPGALDRVVVGAGVNTRMTAAQLPVPTATSFAALGAEVDLDRLAADYLAALDEQWQALAVARGDAHAAGVFSEVSALCATLGQRVAVSLPDGSVLQGEATALGDDGCLLIDAGTGVQRVAAGDVVHLRAQ